MPDHKTGLRKKVSSIFGGAASPPGETTSPPTSETRNNQYIKNHSPAKTQLWEKVKNKLITPEPGVNATKQIAMLIAIPVLVVFLFFALGKNFKSPSATTKPIATANVIKPKQSIWKKPEPYQAGARDPMQFSRASDTIEAKEDMVVNGILYSEDNPVAVFGETTAHEGDKIYGGVLLRINKDSVELLIDGKKKVLKVQRLLILKQE